MIINSSNCLTVSNIKKSIELMDEFVDGDYDYLELRDWLGAIDSHDRGLSVYDNSGRMRISLIIAKERFNDNTPLCNYEPTMTELRQMRYRQVYLDGLYSENTIYSSIRLACEKWEKDVFIPLPIEICLRAQTSYNRMDYGCEWLGGGDWEEKTMYGETTDFYIIGIIMHEPYKHIEQEAVEILDDLKYRKGDQQHRLTQLLEVLKNTDDVLTHKSIGNANKQCKAIDFTSKIVTVQFRDRQAKFPFPESFLNGFLENPQHIKETESAKIIYIEIQELSKEIVQFEKALALDNFDEIYHLVSQHKQRLVESVNMCES